MKARENSEENALFITFVIQGDISLTKFIQVL